MLPLLSALQLGNLGNSPFVGWTTIVAITTMEPGLILMRLQPPSFNDRRTNDLAMTKGYLLVGVSLLLKLRLVHK